MERLRVAKLWDLLVEHARQGSPLTYGNAAVRIGGIARGIGALLQPIQRYCLDHNLPNLSVLVVKSDTRKQGSGFEGDPIAEMRRVRGYAWTDNDNPFKGEG